MNASLRWLPAPVPGLWVPAGLKDFQVGWFVNLLVASLQSEIPGYLILCKEGCSGCPVCLWTVAGSRHPESFRREGSLVTAHFSLAQIPDGRRVLYFPPLVKVISQQLYKLHKKQTTQNQQVDLPLSEVSTGFHKGGDFYSPSPSVFDVDVGSKKERRQTKNQKPDAGGFSPKQKDFEERDLRKMGKAYEDFRRMMEASVGAGEARPGAREVFEWVCERAGITVQRGLELEALQKKWPKSAPDWAKEEERTG